MASVVRRDSWVRGPAEPERLLYGPSPGGKLAVVAGLAFLGAFWGIAVAVADVKAVILGLALLACILVLIDFRIGVVLLIVLMPISRSSVFPHEMGGVTGLNPFNLLLIGTLGSCLLQKLFERGAIGFIPRPLLWLYIAPILVAAALGVSHVGQIPLYFYATGYISFVDGFGYIRDILVKPLLMVFFSLLVAAAAARSRDREKFLMPTLVSVWIMGLMVTAFYAIYGQGLAELASSSERGFLSPLGVHANDLGRMYAIAYALLLFTWAETDDYGLKAILLATMTVVVIALLLTFSRGAWSGFAIVTVLFLISRRNLLSLAGGVALTAAALFFIPDAVYHRLTSGFGEGLNQISAGRIDGIWLPLLPDVMKSPVIGHGLNSILWSDAMRAGAVQLVTHPHNAYLQVLLDMGVIGLLLMGAYYFHVWRGFRKLAFDSRLSPTQRGFYQGAAAGLVGFLIAGVAGSSLMPVPEQSFLWVAIGMMYGERAVRKGT